MWQKLVSWLGFGRGYVWLDELGGDPVKNFERYNELRSKPKGGRILLVVGAVVLVVGGLLFGGRRAVQALNAPPTPTATAAAPTATPTAETPTATPSPLPTFPPEGGVIFIPPATATPEASATPTNPAGVVTAWPTNTPTAAVVFATVTPWQQQPTARPAATQPPVVVYRDKIVYVDREVMVTRQVPVYVTVIGGGGGQTIIITATPGPTQTPWVVVVTATPSIQAGTPPLWQVWLPMVTGP